jgi:hypothetical protein
MEERMIKHRIATAALAASLIGTAAIGAVSAQQTNQGGGAAGVVAAVANIAATDTVDVVVQDSLNNLRALNNVLRNSPILSGIDVTVRDVSVLDQAEIDILNNVLNANDIDIDDVVGVAVLSGGDFIVFV